MQHTPSSTDAPVIALIAGEDSGDQLGAELIEALRTRYPGARFVGIGGRRMLAQGFESWYDIRELSVMGFAEVVKHLPRLLGLRKALLGKLLSLRPAVVVGIDAPDFNLGVERKLKAAGLRTVHYVSPSVWAWREKRAEKIGRSADRVLCLFPMEPPIYAKHGIDARFVGHPLADRFPMVSDRAAARETLGLPHDAPVLAVLPGSRPSEIERVGAIFIAAARRVAEAMPAVRIVVPSANERVHAQLQALLANFPGTPPILTDGQAHDVMLAADAVLLASGTATLEAMLAKRPMVVGYRVSPTSYRIAVALRMLKTDVYSLPNILARACGLGKRLLVPEFMQDECTPDNLSRATLELLGDSERRGAIVAAFEFLHQELRGGLEGRAADHAADAIADLIAVPDLPTASAGH
ncbi:MAG: lipid-A-disaccharide synthase [Luteibacter sp.]|uniref:lipid-A-disaccharide synthase n=1 Tax=Rhodanobacteraceae TaxID=1775411 RepID=UPI0005BD1203|nr:MULTISPECIES: lipid-A-disaccharide synthase [Rhodanobacteraceae]MDQ7996951.1 lipid-A-disaccharide synthase [Luteibacter sp.]MDQ8050507.1 lipid-A-disaccharide synthase [Luteibacter sp.]SDF06588.1 lipid-A-disaccharide synthase [Dyella sp. 333MFSha]SKB90991.1 lipid-A-disaccharide synthase [Luteibacter sp. 22Crub2.1]